MVVGGLPAWEIIFWSVNHVETCSGCVSSSCVSVARENGPPTKPNNQNLKPLLFISKLRRQDYKSTVLWPQHESWYKKKGTNQFWASHAKEVWEKASMIIAPIVEKNKPLCPCQCKNSNEYMHIKKIDIFYSIDWIYETVDYRERCERTERRVMPLSPKQRLFLIQESSTVRSTVKTWQLPMGSNESFWRFPLRYRLHRMISVVKTDSTITARVFSQTSTTGHSAPHPKYSMTVAF